MLPLDTVFPYAGPRNNFPPMIIMKMPPASWLAGLVWIVATGSLLGQSLPTPAGAQIVWASDAFATNYRADGITTFEEAERQIRFELGTFSPGFEPSTATPEQWVSNWIVLQGTDYDMMDQQFIQTATLTTNFAPFAAGGQAYIWGYTSKDVKPDSEWIILGAPAWKWPSVNAMEPSVFTVGQAKPADAIFGSVNPSTGGYQMQLQFVAIPEPSSAVLLLGASLGMVMRRRRGIA